MSKVKRTSYLIIALLLYAVTFNLLLRPNNLIVGGMGGIALIIYKYFNIDVSVTVFVASIICLIWGYLLLEKKIAVQSGLAAILFPLAITLTSSITSYIKIDYNDILVVAIFSGLMLGVCNGIIEKTGYLTGGTDTLSKIISNEFKLSKNTAVIIVEGLIIIGGLFAYGVEQFFNAIIIVYVMNIVGTKIIYNLSKNKVFYIYTDDMKDVKKYIHLGLGYDVTEMKNLQPGHHQHILMTVVDTKDYFKLKEGVIEIDPYAKIIIYDSYEYFERHGKKHQKKQLIEEGKNEVF